jgi:uncharacterized surface protein with fasciclin (FAS1) repeats
MAKFLTNGIIQTVGRLENIHKTIEQLGGTEFIRLMKLAGLESKLESENLTVFVPDNEAIAKYIVSHDVESVSLKTHI